MQQKLVTLKKLCLKMSDTPTLPFLPIFLLSLCSFLRGWQQHGKFNTSSQVWTSLACQRDESGELVSNSCHQQNGQALVCQTKGGKKGELLLKNPLGRPHEQHPNASAAMWLGLVSPRSCWAGAGQRGEVHLEEEAGHLRC